VSSGGAFQPEGKDIPSAPAGNYKISVNLFNNSYKVQAN